MNLNLTLIHMASSSPATTGGPSQSYLYCAAYGSGNFIVRGFGPEPFQMNGRREANAAVHKAAGPGNRSPRISLSRSRETRSNVPSTARSWLVRKSALVAPAN